MEEANNNLCLISINPERERLKPLRSSKLNLNRNLARTVNDAYTEWHNLLLGIAHRGQTHHDFPCLK